MTDNQHYMDGFTIIELMITLAIVTIVFSIAAPNFKGLVQDNKLVSEVHELVATLSLARSEAIKRNHYVTVCRSDDGQACGGKGDWTKGWLVFVDTNADNTVDVEDNVILRHGAIASTNSIIFNRSKVIYTGNGKARGGSNGTFTFCDNRGASSGRGVIVNNTGRARLATDSNANGIVENGSRHNISCP